jgi:hypothetical protein
LEKKKPLKDLSDLKSRLGIKTAEPSKEPVQDLKGEKVPEKPKEKQEKQEPVVSKAPEKKRPLDLKTRLGIKAPIELRPIKKEPEPAEEKKPEVTEKKPEVTEKKPAPEKQQEKPASLSDMITTGLKPVAKSGPSVSSAFVPPKKGEAFADTLAISGTDVLKTKAEVAPPPFLQPKKPDLSRDPFASVAPPPRAEVRPLVDDGVPVTSKEVGKSKVLLYIVVASLVVPAFLAGNYCGRGIKDRILINKSIDDGQAIKKAVDKAASFLEELEPRLRSAVGLATKERKPDMEFVRFIEEKKQERPLKANAFASKNYNLFKPAIVDNLFSYYNDFNILWDKLRIHAIRTRNDEKMILEGRGIAKEFATNDYALVFFRHKDYIVGRIVIIDSSEQTKDGLYVKYWVKEKMGQKPVPKEVYHGGPFEENLTKVTIGLQKSEAMLVEKVKPFREYLLRLKEMGGILNKLLKTQTLLKQDLEEIASMKHIFVGCTLAP